jgi:hypothetical protein
MLRAKIVKIVNAYGNRVVDVKEPDGFNKAIDQLLALFNSNLKEQGALLEKSVGEKRKKFSKIITTDGKEAMTIPEWQMWGYNQAIDQIIDLIRATNTLEVKEI